MAAVILSLAVVGTLEAQTVPAGLISSPTRASTATRYRTAADDFIRPGDYTGVKFDKFFGFASWAAANKAVLGYAQRFSDTYLGVYYGGTLWGGATSFGYTERDINAFGAGTKTFLSYAAVPAFGASSPDNRIAVLLGVADMGFRLSFASTHQSFKKSDIAVSGGTPAYYKSYQTDYGVLAPQLSWSMAKNLSANGIKPYVDLNLNFYRDYTKYEAYTTTGTTQGEQIGTSNNSFRPGLAVGLGGYTFYKQGGFSAGLDLDYTLGLELYDNEFSYTDSGSFKIKKIKGTVNGAGTVYTETSTITNNLVPSLSAGWSGDKLGLKAKLNFGLNLNSTNSTANSLTAAYELQKNGIDSTSTLFSFAPTLQLAMQYKLVPNKLTINAGSVITNSTPAAGGNPAVPGISITTTKGSTYLNGTENPNSSYKEVTHTVGATTASFLLGASFNFSDNVMLDASTGVANGTSAGGINVFDSGVNGLFHFGSLLVSLKF